MATFALHDVDDVSKLVAFVVTRSGLSLSYHDREDLQQELTIHAWQIAETFDPERGSFSNYLFRTASLRVVDWQRKRNGRTRWVFHDRVYERPRPEFVPLDGGLDDTLPARSGDPALDRSPDLAGVLGARDGQAARDYEALGIDAA